MAHQPPHLLGALHEDTLRRLLEVHAAARSPRPLPSPPPLHRRSPTSRPLSSKLSVSSSSSRTRIQYEHPSSPSSSSSPASFFSSTALIAIDQERRDLEARTVSLQRALLRTHFHHIHEVQNEETVQRLPLPPPPPQPRRASSLFPLPLPPSSPPLHHSIFNDDMEDHFSHASSPAVAAAAAAAGWGWAQNKQRADRLRDRVLKSGALTRWLAWLLHRRLAKEREKEMEEAMVIVKKRPALARIRRRASNFHAQHMAMLRVVLVEGGREGRREGRGEGGKEGEQERPLPSSYSSPLYHHQQQQDGLPASSIPLASDTTIYTRAALRLLLTRGFHRLHRYHLTLALSRSLEHHAIQHISVPSLLRKGFRALLHNNKHARRRLSHQKTAGLKRDQQRRQQQRALQQWCAWSRKKRNRRLLVEKGELWWTLRMKEGGMRRWECVWCEGRREGRRIVRGMDAWYEQRLQQKGVKTWVCTFVARRREETMRLKRGEGWREGGRWVWGVWRRMLGRARERKRGEERLARAAGQVCERRKMRRALVGRWKEGWMLGVKEEERARLRKGEELRMGRAGGRAVEEWKAWTARKMLRRALGKRQGGKGEGLLAGAAPLLRAMQLLKTCEGWAEIAEEEKDDRALWVRGEEQFDRRVEERCIRAWVAHIVVRKKARAALESVERAMDPRYHHHQQQQQQQRPALSPSLTSAPSLPFLPIPHLLYAAYTRLVHRRIRYALDRWKAHPHQQARLFSSLVRADRHYLHTQWQGLRRAVQQQKQRGAAARMAIEKLVVPYRRRRWLKVWMRRREGRERGREERRGRVEGHLRWRERMWGMKRLREMVGRSRKEREREGRAVILWEGGGEGKMRRRWRKRKLGRVWRIWCAFHQQQHLARHLMLANETNLAVTCLKMWRQALQEKQQAGWEAGALGRLFRRWHRRAGIRAVRRARMAETVGRYVGRVEREKGTRAWRKWMEGRREDTVIVGERNAWVREGGGRMKVLLGLRRWSSWVVKKQQRRKEGEEREGRYCRNRLLRNAVYGWSARCRGRGGRERWMLLAERWHRRRVLKEGLRERWGAWAGGRKRRERRKRILKKMEERAGRWRERRWARVWQRWSYWQDFLRGQEAMAVEWEKRRRMEGGREGGEIRTRTRVRNVEISGRGFISLLRRLVLLRQQQRQAVLAAKQARELIVSSEGWRKWVRRRRWVGKGKRIQESPWECWERDKTGVCWRRWREWVRRRKEGNLMRALRREVELFRLLQQQEEEEEEEKEEEDHQEHQHQPQQPDTNERGGEGGRQQGPRIVRTKQLKTNQDNNTKNASLH